MKRYKAILFTTVSILSFYPSHGKYTIIQKYDSIEIQTIINRSNYRLRENHGVDVFINNMIYKIDIAIYKDTLGNDRTKNIIYLPDTINPNSKIKIKVYTSDLKDKPRILKVKSKTYRFKMSESKNSIVYINYKKDLQLFPRKQTSCGGNFW